MPSTEERLEERDLHSKLKNNSTPQHDPIQEQRFPPKGLSSNQVSKSSIKPEKLQLPSGRSSQFTRGGYPQPWHPFELTFSLASDTKGLSMLRHDSICSCSSSE